MKPMDKQTMKQKFDSLADKIWTLLEQANVVFTTYKHTKSESGARELDRFSDEIAAACDYANTIG
jgi:hypothetical protein